MGTETRILSSSASGTSAVRIDPRDRSRGDEDEDGDEYAREDERSVDAKPGDEHGRERGSNPLGCKEEHLDNAEYTGENVIRDGPLKERQPGDVGEAVGDAEHAEREQCDSRRRPETNGGERDRADRQPDQERRAEPANTGEREGAERSEERADAHRRTEVADAAVPQVEEIECHHHQEDL